MLLGLIGDPVSLSWSEFLFNRLFRYENKKNIYVAANVSRDSLPRILDPALSPFHAMNITAPYKEASLIYLPNRSPEVWKIGSTNLAVRSGEGFIAHNADYLGFKHTLESGNIELDGRNIAICGSGGLARTVLYTVLTEYSPASVHILTRDPESTKKRYNGVTMFSSILLENYETKSEFDVAINCTSLGMRTGDKSPLEGKHFKSRALAIDLTYQNRETEFMRNAVKNGGKAFNGREMFFSQARETYRIAFGDYPPDDLFKRVSEEVIKWAEKA
ncbi:MAG: hypothetical protein M1414_02105 [Candidatus Thermoplasmatota archaeon]|jgi:shikimate dehydrogenase|nr:hypothetical protein [Candidatus Thermoplasmatota archaeon]MCL5987680.1 hypothetical protein [Candidatus Thermoplasmatota archaeon]